MVKSERGLCLGSLLDGVQRAPPPSIWILEQPKSTSSRMVCVTREHDWSKGSHLRDEVMRALWLPACRTRHQAPRSQSWAALQRGEELEPPANCHVCERPWDWPSGPGPLSETVAWTDVLTTICERPWARTFQLICAWIPDSQKWGGGGARIINVCCLQQLSAGAICYTVTNNETGAEAGVCQWRWKKSGTETSPIRSRPLHPLWANYYLIPWVCLQPSMQAKQT